MISSLREDCFDVSWVANAIDQATLAGSDDRLRDEE